MGKRLNRLWVVGTVALISFIGYTSQIFVVFPAVRYRFSDPELLRVLLPFNILLAFVFYNYALTVRTDPGRVPKGWVSLSESARLASDAAKGPLGGARARADTSLNIANAASRSETARDWAHRGQEADGRSKVLPKLSRSVLAPASRRTTARS